MDPLTPAREPEAARRLRWRIERIRDPEHPLFKPRLRGWIHAAMAPLTLAAGIVLIVLAPTATLRWAAGRGGSDPGAFDPLSRITRTPARAGSRR